MATGVTISSLTAASTLDGSEVVHVVQSGTSKKATTTQLAGNLGLLKSNNLSELPSKSTARTNLGVAIGSDVQAYNALLAAIAALGTNGLITRTASGTVAARTITGTANEVTVTNGDGVSGAPTLSLPTALTFTGKTVTGGTFSGVTVEGSSTFSGTTITASTEFRGTVLTSNSTSTIDLKTSGGTQFRVAHTASAVNSIGVRGNASGFSPDIFAFGSNTNVGVNLVSKAAGNIDAYTNDGAAALQFRISHTASSVNYEQVTGGATGNGVTNLALGSDSNIDRIWQSRGTGSQRFTNTAGTEQFRIAHTASAVNYWQVTGAATGSFAQFTSTGSDTDVGASYSTKGAAGVNFYTNAFGNVQFQLTHTASAVEYLRATGAASGGSPTLSAQGSSTNIPVTVANKGTAVTKLTGQTTQTTVGAAGGASALPATPTGYLLLGINGTNYAVPYYAAS